MTTYELHRYPETLAVVQLPPGADLPKWVESATLMSITATASETSIICAAPSVPKKAKAARGFAAFAVAGPLDFSLTGVLVTLLQPLAEAEISVFTQSTYDTDWILVAKDKADEVEEIWRRSGHTVSPAIPI